MDMADILITLFHECRSSEPTWTKQELGNGSPKWNAAIISVINYTSTFPTFPITSKVGDNSILAILGGCTILTHKYNK